jgi:hypothetical protein
MNGPAKRPAPRLGRRQDKLLFAFAVHNHQPVGNFREIVARVHERAYAPFLHAIRRYPAVNFSLHISGALLEWMEEEASNTVAAIRDMVAAGQCEILAGTYYEALAPVAPEHDVKDSIVAYARKLEKLFGATPKGAWIAERVYEPHLPRLLADAGMGFAALDDWHFKVAGIPTNELDRPWLAEHQGATLTVCPISERLRYLVPFAPVEEVIAYLRGLFESGACLACLADDGEKFGEWPGTHEHCYDDGWLGTFFAALSDNGEWLQVVSLGEAVETLPASGPAYLPATSYREMTRWALPTETQKRLDRLGPDFDAGGAFADLVPGGSFRSFFHKYSEANYFHKRVQEVSRRLEASGGLKGGERDRVRRHLWRAEANDAYWHGIFGGFYLPHLRRGVKNELVRAEEILDRCLKTWESEEIGDLDANGAVEIKLKNENVVAVLTERGLNVIEFARRSPPAVLTDVPARRYEPYHDRLNGADECGRAGAETIHAPRGVKEEGLEKFLVYDRRPKNSFLERLFAGETDLEMYAREAGVEFTSFSWGEPVRAKGGWRAHGLLTGLDLGTVGVDKEIILTDKALVAQYVVETDLAQELIFGLEITLNLHSELPDKAFVKGVNNHECNDDFEARAGNRFAIYDRLANWELIITLEPAYELWHVPLYTVNCSESGFEKTYQGSSFFFWHRFPGGKKTFGSRVAMTLR